MKWLLRIGYFLAMRCRLYTTWSRIYRWLYHRKYSGVPLEVGLTPEVVTESVKLLRWTRDGFWELKDAIGSPRWVQFALNEVRASRPQPEGSIDCDEYAAWCANVLAYRFQPTILSVSWKDSKGARGHNVCLFASQVGIGHVSAGGETQARFFHTGNWGMHGPFQTRDEAVRHVFDLCKIGDGYLIGWTVMYPDLAVIATGFNVRLGA